MREHGRNFHLQPVDSATVPFLPCLREGLIYSESQLLPRDKSSTSERCWRDENRINQRLLNFAE
ncbi:hypothetical protein CFBP3846_P500053 (plasmid) [Pseudomonas syringae pv. avii]|uniref:Uncharacterized protein n=1 Tax=Pseudomonas syringae pv. avii TaxID=663959 RepID=A0ABY1UG78_PSESX|nr:hypothetical protein CFBP3846_P500053 [Pseudomonas syringae pv. avii]